MRRDTARRVWEDEHGTTSQGSHSKIKHFNGLRRGGFCYEGAAALSFQQQTQHPNAVHGRDLEQEEHPNSKTWVASLLKLAEEKGSTLNWINCGLCVDERGVNDAIPGTKRGTPGDLWNASQRSTNTLIIPTR